jgi:superfamily II DNA or RNA helicase
MIMSIRLNEEKISTYLGIPVKELGTLSGTKNKRTGKVDLAMLQSLTKLENLDEIALTNNYNRNKKIADRTVMALRDKRFPLLISDRKEHLDRLALIISEVAMIQDLEIIRLDGDLTSKQRREATEKIPVFRFEGKPVLLMSTASLIGEGFDLPALAHLSLVRP